jgi:hypothetical protein
MRFQDYLKKQCKWSTKTFGPGLRTLGILKHIEKEIEEVKENPSDLYEWVDIVILAIDGYWRHGGRDLVQDLNKKMDICMQRTYPYPASDDEVSEHIRSS